MPRLLQPAFTRGEVSPHLHARVDLALYQVALKTARNLFVRSQGGVSNRAGTKFVAPTAFQDSQSVLIPFIFSTEQAYILEFAEGIIRIFANGSYVADPASANTITDITINAGPGFRVITTDTPHGYVTGQAVHISGVVATGSYAINGVWRILGIAAADQFVIAPPSAIVGSYISGGETATDISVANPYVESELPDLRFAQSADVLTVTHRDHPQNEFRRLSATSFTFSEVTFEYGPFLDANEDFSLQVHSNLPLGNVTLTATGSVFLEEHEGALIKLESRDLSKIQPWESGGIIAQNSQSTLGVLRRSNGRVYKCVTNLTASAGVAKIIRSGSVRPVHEFGVQSDGAAKQISTDVEQEGVAWEYLHSGFGIARILTYSSATSVTARVLRRFPDDCVGGLVTSAGPFTMTGDGVDTTLSIAGATDHNKYNYSVTFDGVLQRPELYEVNAATDVMTFYTAPATGVAVSAREVSSNNRTDIWSLGAWSEDQGYPSVVSYHQDRLFYAATREAPQTVWGSCIADYADFGQSSPIVDDDAVSFTMNARQINAIRDLVPLDKLIALTSAGAWKVTDGENEVITPSTVGFKPQSYRGAKLLRSVIVGDRAIYIHNAGREARTLSYRVESDKFGGEDLNIAANHLLTKERTAVDMDYAEEPHNLVQIVRSDGKLLALVYDEEQQVTGWAPWDTLDGRFERVCSIPEDGDDAVYAIVERDIGGTTDRFIERFANREIEDVLDGVFVDCASSFDGRGDGVVTLTLEFPIGPGTIILTASDAVFSLSIPPDLVTLTIEDAEGNSYTIRGLFASISDPTQIEITPITDIDVDVQAALEGRSTTDWGIGFDAFSGLGHLEGATVTIFADGGEEEDQVVSGGQIVLANPAVVVHVGLRITCDFEPLQINIAGGETVRDVGKHVGAVSLIVLQSRDLKIGRDADHLDDIPTRVSDDEYDASALVDGVLRVHIASTLSVDGNFFLRHDSPLPLTILAVIPDTKFGTNG